MATKTLAHLDTQIENLDLENLMAILGVYRKIQVLPLKNVLSCAAMDSSVHLLNLITREKKYECRIPTSKT